MKTKKKGNGAASKRQNELKPLTDEQRRMVETNMPLAAYNVSGEYSIVKAAAQQGWIDEKKLVMENMIAIKRAGAQMIITYHALDVARWLKEEQ